MTTVTAPMVVVTAVRAETRAVLSALRGVQRFSLPGLQAWRGQAGGRVVSVVQSGIGPTRAMAALQGVPLPHALVLSVGFAGALVTTAEPGDVVLPAEVRWEADRQTHRYAIPSEMRRVVRSRLPPDLRARVIEGALLSSPTIVASSADKRAAADRSGAVAVEMEAAGLVPIARARGTELLVLRVILDAADVSLVAVPPDLDSSWRARARLLGRPGAWSSVLNVARHVPLASRALRRAVAAVLPAL